MPTIPVIENPRRRRRRSTLTAKQLRAGFGGKGRMRGRPAKRRRRRNPAALATLAANPRRRRRRVARYYAPARRRRRNAGLPGLGGFGRMLNLPVAFNVSCGILTAHVTPKIVRRFWPAVPTTGFGGTSIRVGSILVVAWGVRSFTRSNTLAGAILAGGIGYELYRLANQFLLPALGLSGAYDDDRFITQKELYDIGVGGYQPSELAGYQPITDAALAA